MNNKTLQIKVKEYLNKLSSNDFENLACWQIANAFNSYQLEWCRRTLHGLNIIKEGDEQSTSRIDDLDTLIVDTLPLKFIDKGIYFETDISQWPINYLRFKRIVLSVKNKCCDKLKRMTVYEGEEANVDIYLDDVNRKPNYKWGFTFFTMTSNKINIYHNNEFSIDECVMKYYRQPNKVQILGCADDIDGSPITIDVECEFTEDLTEILVAGAASQIAGNIENVYQNQRLENDVEKNN